MSIMGPYVHGIDPVIGTVLGIHLWWYGLSYALGFLNAHLFLKRTREQQGLSLRSVYDLSLLLTLGVLLGGRVVEVCFYEWPFYRAHPGLMPAYWLGGMATHGLLAGGLAGIWLFSRLERTPFLSVTDALAVPAAVILAMGRIGNFIDGQIVGSVTTVWWAVKFPDAEGFRHPVVLYDGLKNLLLVPILLYAGRRNTPQGFRTGLFLFLYAFVRIFIDLFREYPTTLLGLATGQALNLLLSVVGLGLMVASCRRKRGPVPACAPQAVRARSAESSGGIGWRRALFAALLVFSLCMPSDWTQDVPARYGQRHPGLVHSALYPKIATSP
jgi:phosphatidylglycerol:prolipoprotein diacylglycerol transferase